MNEYEYSKKIIEDYLNKEEVIDNDEVISAYSLYNILKKKFKPLFDVNYNKEFEDKIYDLYINKNLLRLLKVKLHGDNCYCSIMPSFGKDTDKIIFIFGYCIKCEIQRSHSKNVIKQTQKKDYSYFSGVLDDKTLEACAEEINHTFDVLDEYRPYFMDTGYIRQTFDEYDGLVCGINVNSNGEVHYLLNLSNNYNNYCDSDNWEDVYALKNMIYRNKDNILKRTPIKISSLNDIYKNAYLEMTSKGEKQKTYSK